MAGEYKNVIAQLIYREEDATRRQRNISLKITRGFANGLVDQMTDMRRACEDALEWLQHHGGDSLPLNEPGLAQLIGTLESAIKKAQ